MNESLIGAEHLRTHGGAIINVGSIASDLAFAVVEAALGIAGSAGRIAA